MTIRQVLSELGMYQTPPRGRPPTQRNAEDALQLKRERCKLSQAATRAEIRACKAAGLDHIARARGRPKLYETPEEAKSAHLVQSRACNNRSKVRLIEALQALTQH